MTTTRDIRQAVQKIEERDGVCTAQAFVDEARHEDSLIHNIFTWDDTEEANLWRIHKARTLIASVTITDADGTQRQGYISTKTALADEEKRAQVFAATRALLIGCRRRLAALNAQAGIINAIDTAIEGLLDDDGEDEENGAA